MATPTIFLWAHTSPREAQSSSSVTAPDDAARLLAREDKAPDPPGPSTARGLLRRLPRPERTASPRSGTQTLTWVVVVPFHDADVHGGARLRHRRSLPLRRVAFHTAPLHRLEESKGIGEGQRAEQEPSLPPGSPSPLPLQPLPTSMWVTQNPELPQQGKAEASQAASNYNPETNKRRASALLKARAALRAASFTISSILLNCGGGPVPTCIWLGIPEDDTNWLLWFAFVPSKEPPHPRHRQSRRSPAR